MKTFSHTTMFHIAAAVAAVFAFASLLAAARELYIIECLMVLLGIYPWSCAYHYLKLRETTEY